MNAAKMAVGLGAFVTVLDVNMDRLRQLDDLFGGRIQTLASNSYNIAQTVKTSDLLIGAVLVPGARAPRIVTEEMIKTMQPGSVVVDVAIDHREALLKPLIISLPTLIRLLKGMESSIIPFPICQVQ